MYRQMIAGKEQGFLRGVEVALGFIVGKGQKLSFRADILLEC